MYENFKLTNHCIYCYNDKDLVSLNDKDYICKKCVSLSLEKLSMQGHDIELRLSKMAPNIAKKLMNLFNKTEV